MPVPRGNACLTASRPQAAVCGWEEGIRPENAAAFLRMPQCGGSAGCWQGSGPPRERRAVFGQFDGGRSDRWGGAVLRCGASLARVRASVGEEPAPPGVAGQKCARGGTGPSLLSGWMPRRKGLRRPKALPLETAGVSPGPLLLGAGICLVLIKGAAERAVCEGEGRRAVAHRLLKPEWENNSMDRPFVKLQTVVLDAPGARALPRFTPSSSAGRPP